MAIIIDTDNDDIADVAPPVSLPRDYFDAFGRFRVSTPTVLFDSKLTNDAQPLWWDDQAVSGAGTSSTYNTNQGSNTIAVSNTTAGMRARQTFRWFNYQPGSSQRLFFTGVFGGLNAGITKRIGIFNSQNGLYFATVGTTPCVGVRSFVTGSATDLLVNQQQWNMDRLDGTKDPEHNQSNVNIDFSRRQIMVIEFEYLGEGSIWFGFVVNGDVLWCHRQDNANRRSSLVYMSTANLPLRYEISNDGTGPADSLVCVANVVATDGGSNNTGWPNCIERGTSGLTTANDTNLYPILAVRLKSTALGARVKPIMASAVCSTAVAVRWQLLLNPTVTGTALSFTGLTNSPVEYDISRTNGTTVSGGQLLAAKFGLNQTEGTFPLGILDGFQLGSSIAGVSDVLVLAGGLVAASTPTLYGSLTWQECQ